MRKTEKNSDNKKKISFFDAWRLNLRAWRVFAGRCPMLFVTAFLSSAFSALSPYLTIWLSARLIDELKGARSAKTRQLRDTYTFGIARYVAYRRTAQTLARLL